MTSSFIIRSKIPIIEKERQTDVLKVNFFTQGEAFLWRLLIMMNSVTGSCYRCINLKMFSIKHYLLLCLAEERSI
jgi:hypothetical protein